jgi:uncharacterized protein
MRKLLTTFLLLTVLNISVYTIEVPQLKNYATDLTRTLRQDQLQELEQLLQSAETTTSSQIVFLMAPSLEGESLESYTYDVTEQNKIGQADQDNGILLFVALNDKKVRIEVGYGLESIMTDAASGFIIREQIIPYFKKGDYYTGIKTGLTTITGIINNEYEISDKELAKYQKNRESQPDFSFLIGIIITIIIIISSMTSRHRRRGRYHRSSTFYGGFFGGSGGSSSGGSFGGFSGGGGSFGGGGASGGW